MQIEYADIIGRVSDKPVWWVDGVPRYDAFRPDFAGTEIALVQTECRECRTRYDVAVHARGPSFESIRNSVALENRLNVGNPPLACRLMGARCFGGYTMTSLEIRIIEFWSRIKGSDLTYQRDASMERALADANWDSEKPLNNSVWDRILDSDRIDEWSRARKDGHFAAMVAILEAFDCERPNEVAHMLDVDRRHRALWNEIQALRTQRLGPI